MLKDNLIMLRNIHGFSQEEVAGKIGISRQAYARWESGAAVPDIVKCGRLAAVSCLTFRKHYPGQVYGSSLSIRTPCPAAPRIGG